MATPTDPMSTDPTHAGPTAPDSSARTAPTNPAYRPGRAELRKVLSAGLVLGAWVWAILLLVAAVVPHVIDRFGQVDGSLFSSASVGPRWFLFVLALVLVTEGLGSHVANGQTRRSFTRQIVVGFVAVALAYAVVTLGVFAAERALYDLRGWRPDPIGGHVFTSTDQWGLVLLEAGLLTSVFALSGLAVGATYYRWRGLIGTLLLPVTVGLAFVASGALQTEWTPELLGVIGLDSIPLGLGVAVVVAVAAALVALTYAALRNAPVRPGIVRGSS